MPVLRHCAELTLAILIIGSLSACTGTPGQPGEVLTVYCDGQDWRQCHSQVSGRCGKLGYLVLNQLTDAGSAAAGNNDSLIHGTFARRTMVARCKSGTD